MTYIDYLNEFHRWLESHELPVRAQMLYIKLLHVFNRAGWPELVSVDNLRLMSMIAVESKRAMIHARDALVEAGFLEVRKGKPGCANQYRLRSVYDTGDVTEDGAGNDTKNGAGNGAENVTENVPRNVSEKVPLNKNKTKKKTKTKTVPLCPPMGETGFGEELQGAFEAWLAYKTEKRQSYQPTGLQCLVTEIRRNAERYGEAAVAALIRECMACNWQGIAFDRLTRGAPPEEEHVWRQDPETGEWR